MTSDHHGLKRHAAGTTPRRGRNWSGRSTQAPGEPAEALDGILAGLRVQSRTVPCLRGLLHLLLRKAQSRGADGASRRKSETESSPRYRLRASEERQPVEFLTRGQAHRAARGQGALSRSRRCRSWSGRPAARCPETAWANLSVFYTAET